MKLATTSSGEEFAVKIMTLPKPGEKPANDGATHQEILNEVQVLAKLRHANCLYMKARRRAARPGGAATSVQAVLLLSRRRRVARGITSP